MKQYILTLIALIPGYMSGQSERVDSLPAKTLEEITIVAAQQRSEATKTVYLPDSRQRSSAADGIQLLARMAIPQLCINPMSSTIKTADNQDVSIFINHHPASTEDVAGLNPADVKKVEYMDFPVDPRFLRAQHVVNFIIREYAYGGYTKPSAKEQFLIHAGEISVYSKLSHRQLEYDLMASGNYDYNPHIGTDCKEHYKLPSGTVMRHSLTDTGIHHEHTLCAGLRVSWLKGSDMSFRNRVSYRRHHIPVNTTAGRAVFSEIYRSGKFTAESPSSSDAIEWDSELYASLGKGWAINGNIHTEFTANSTTDNYTSSSSTIKNSADENAWFLRGDFQLNKKLSEKISLFSHIAAAGYNSEINYTGTDNTTNTFKQSFTGLYIGLSMNFHKVSGSLDGGFAFESNHINRDRNYDRYPFTHINVQYAPDQKHSASLWLQYATMSPGAAMKNPNIIRQSELMYISGNPSIESSRLISGNISYTWLPDNNWQMSAFATLFKIIDRQIEIYSPDITGNAIVRKYRNDGDYNHGQIGARLTRKLFNGNLTLSVAPRLLIYKTTGLNSISHCPFSCSASADYYLGNFFFNAYCYSRNSYVDGETSYLRKMPAEYSVSAGWASKGWNIQISGANLFQSSWKLSDDILHTRWYDCSLTQLGANFHRRIILTVTYTISYGKRLSSSDELPHSIAPSTTAILR